MVVVAVSGCGDSGPQKGPSPSAAYSLVDGVYQGAVVEHRHGPVQVQITVKDGRISEVDAIQKPDAFLRSIDINAGAIETLNQEVLVVQSTYIDFVSGATLTSNAYVGSLQDAIDQANRG
jgi:uncharacterized protein with FMN-binding domain